MVLNPPNSGARELAQVSPCGVVNRPLNGVIFITSSELSCRSDSL